VRGFRIRALIPRTEETRCKSPVATTLLMLSPMLVGAVSRISPRLRRRAADCLRLVKFHHDVFGRVGTRAHPARPARAGLPIEQILNRVSGVLGGIVNLSGRGILLMSVARQLGFGELLCSPIVLPRSRRTGPETPPSVP
jgi:hypothetical protein